MCLELIATIYHILILDTGFFVCFLENSLVFMYYSKKFTLCINTTCLVVTKYYSGEKCKTKKSYSTSKHYRSLTFTDHDNNTWKYLYICFVVVVLLVEASILIFLTRNFQPKPSFRFRGISEKFLFLGIIHKPGSRQLKREGLGNCVHYSTAPHIVLH